MFLPVLTLTPLFFFLYLYLPCRNLVLPWVITCRNLSCISVALPVFLTQGRQGVSDKGIPQPVHLYHSVDEFWIKNGLLYIIADALKKLAILQRFCLQV